MMTQFNEVFIDGLVQERHNSSAIAVELHISCPSICVTCFSELTHNLLMYVLVIYQWRISFVFHMCVWKALVIGWWPGVCLVQLYLLRAIQCNQRDHAGLVCAYQKQPKMCMKWGQESCLKNVNNKRPFSTCFRSLNTYSPKGIPTAPISS